MMSSVHSQGVPTLSSSSSSTSLAFDLTRAIPTNTGTSVASSTTSSTASTITVTARLPSPHLQPPAPAVSAPGTDSTGVHQRQIGQPHPHPQQQQQLEVVYTPPSTSSETDDEEDPFGREGAARDEIFGKAGVEEEISSPTTTTTTSTTTTTRSRRMMPYVTESLKDRSTTGGDDDDMSSVFSSLQPPLRSRNTGRSRKLSTDESRKDVRRMIGQSLKEAKERETKYEQELERAKREESKNMEELRAQHKAEISRIASQHRQEALWTQQKHAAELRNAKKHTGYGAELIQGLHKSYGQQMETLILEVAEAKNVIKSLQHKLGLAALDGPDSDVARESPVPGERPQSQSAELSPVNLQVNIQFVGLSKPFDVPSIVVPHGGVSFTQLKHEVHCAIANYLAFLRSKDSVHSSSSESANLIYSLSLNLEKSVKLLFFGNGTVNGGEEITPEKWAERGLKTDDLIACIEAPPLQRQPPVPSSAKASVAPSISAASRVSTHRARDSLDDMPPPPTASSTETARTSAIWGPAAAAMSERSYTRSTINQTFPFRATDTIPEVPSPEGSSVRSETASLVDERDIDEDDEDDDEDEEDDEGTISATRAYDMAKELERINNEFDQLREGRRSVLGHTTGEDRRTDGVNVRGYGADEPLLGDDSMHQSEEDGAEDGEDDEDDEEMRGEGVDLGVGPSNRGVNDGLSGGDTVRLLGKDVPDVHKQDDDESSDIGVGEEEHLYEMVGEGADGDEDTDEDPNKILKGSATEEDEDDSPVPDISREEYEKERDHLLQSEKVPLYVNEFLMGPVLESTLEKGKQRADNPFNDESLFSRKRGSGASVASRTTQRSSIYIPERLDTQSIRETDTQRAALPKQRPSLAEVRYRDQPDESKSEESIHLLSSDTENPKDSDGEGEAATATPRPRVSRRTSSPVPPASANTTSSRTGGVAAANPWGNGPFYNKQQQQQQPQQQQQQPQQPQQQHRPEDRPGPSKQPSFTNSRSSGSASFPPFASRSSRHSIPKSHGGAGQPKFGGVYGFPGQQDEGRHLSKEEWIAGTIAESAPLSRSGSPDSIASSRGSNPEFEPLSSRRSHDTSSVVSENREFSSEEINRKLRQELQDRYPGFSPSAHNSMGGGAGGNGAGGDYMSASAIFNPGGLRRERSVSQASSMSASMRNLPSTAGPYYDPLSHQQAPPSVPFYDHTGSNFTPESHGPPPPPPGFELLGGHTVERMNPFLDRHDRPTQPPSASQLAAAPPPHLIQLHPNLSEAQIYAARQAFMTVGIDPNTLSHTQFYEFATSTPELQKQHLRIMMQSAAAAAAGHRSARGHSLPVSPPPVGMYTHPGHGQFWSGASQSNVVNRSMTPPVLFGPPQGKAGGVGVQGGFHHPVYVYGNPGHPSHAPPPPPPHGGQWPW